MANNDLRLVRIRVSRRELEKGNSFLIKQLESADGKGARPRLPNVTELTNLDPTSNKVLESIAKEQEGGNGKGEGEEVFYGVVNGKVKLRRP